MFRGFTAGAEGSLGGLRLPQTEEAVFDAASGNIIVADAALLFTGKYEKSGSDLLIIDKDGDKVVVLDYFAAKKRPNLQTPDGAVLTADIVDILAGANLAQYAQTEGESGRAPIGRRGP